VSVPSCERCRDTGFEIATLKAKGDKDFEVAKMCECRRRETAQSGNALPGVLRIPPRYAHCTLETFEVLEGGSRLHREAYSKVFRYCGEYRRRADSKHINDKGLGLLLTGLNGTGKTHLAVAALRELAVQHGVRGQFWDFHELLREIKNCYNATTAMTEYELFEPIIDLEVMLLDDLGAWKMTDWMKDTLFYVINKRYLANRPTLITTNYPDRDVVARDVLTTDRALASEYLVDRIGAKLRSRLLEACAVIRLDGPDRRQMACQASNQKLVSMDGS
jgi:DNA replication protein DnaC